MAYVNNYVYRLRLGHNGNSRTCYPCGLENLTKVVKRDKGFAFCKTTMTGNLIFIGADYTWLKAIEDGANNCLDITATLDISCDQQVTWTEYFLGKFTTADGKWDIDRCRFEVSLKSNDIYTCLEENGDNSFNIITIPTEYTINDPGEIPSYEWGIKDFDDTDPTWDCVSIQSSPPTGGQWAFVHCDTTTTVNIIYGFWWREYKWTSCIAGNPAPPSGTGWVLDTNDCAGTGQAKYIRPPLEPTPSSTEFYFIDTCTNGVPDIPTDPDPSLLELMDYDCAENWAWWWARVPTPGTDFTHNRSLYDVVLSIAQDACPQVTDIKSDFFEWNPPGDTSGYVAGENYVTGDSPNKPNQLYLSQKSDILLPTASQSATVGNITWSEITTWIYNMFQVKWIYDDVDDTIRFEHVSHWQFATGLDLTVPPYARMLIGKNVYTHLKDRRPKFESFNHMEANGIDFVGMPIVYDYACVGSMNSNDAPIEVNVPSASNNTIAYSVEKVTTDLKYINDNPADISRDGFVMLCALEDIGGNLSVDYEVGMISGNLQPNGHLSWANLHDKYWRHDRILIVGNMNGNDETFESAKRTKRQAGIEIYGCCDTDIDTQELVKTELGFGIIDEYRVSLFTNKLTMNIDL